MKQNNIGCAAIYVTQEEAAILLGAVVQGRKHLVAYMNHEMFSNEHAEASTKAVQVLDSFAEEIEGIVGNMMIRGARTIR